MITFLVKKWPAKYVTIDAPEPPAYAKLRRVKEMSPDYVRVKNEKSEISQPLAVPPTPGYGE